MALDENDKVKIAKITGDHINNVPPFAIPVLIVLTRDRL